MPAFRPAADIAQGCGVVVTDASQIDPAAAVTLPAMDFDPDMIAGDGGMHSWRRFEVVPDFELMFPRLDRPKIVTAAIAADNIGDTFDLAACWSDSTHGHRVAIWPL